MLKSAIAVLIVLAMLFASTLAEQNENEPEKAKVTVGGLCIESESQDPQDENTILFKYNEADQSKYFLADAEIQVEPVNIVLLLDESLSMENSDVEDLHGFKSESRIDIEKRISRRILESINSDSQIALVIFGGDTIREYPFGSDLDLEGIVDSIIPVGEMSCGGKGLDRAIDCVLESNVQSIIVIISDGVETGGLYTFGDVVWRAVTNEIVIYSVMLGRAGNELEMKEIAGVTNGKFYQIYGERDTKSLVSDLVDLINGYGLENFLLELRAPRGVYFKEVTSSYGEEPRMEQEFLAWNKINHGEPNVVKIKFEVRGNEVSRHESILAVDLHISFKDPLEPLPDELPLLHVGDLQYRFETKYEHLRSRALVSLKEYRLCIGSIILPAILFIAYIIKKRKKKAVLYDETRIYDTTRKIATLDDNTLHELDTRHEYLESPKDSGESDTAVENHTLTTSGECDTEVITPNLRICPHCGYVNPSTVDQCLCCKLPLRDITRVQ